MALIQRPRDMRRLLVLGVCLVLGAACGASEPETESSATSGVTTTTDTAATPTLPSTTTTTDPNSPQCGGVFPVFRADIDSPTRANVFGVPGPGPGSYPAAEGQLVAHWLGDEYATFELRWPAEPADYAFAADIEVAGHPATLPELVGGRAVVYVNVDLDRSDPCRLLSVEAYGAWTEPLMDSIFVMLDGLQSSADLDDYLAAVEGRTTPADDTADRPPGRCAEPVIVALDEYGEVPAQEAVEVARRFLADRVAGARATDCLTESALAAFPSAGTDYYNPPLCLFECGDGSRLVDFEADSAWSVLLGFEDVDGTRRPMREEYRVDAVATSGGELQALIIDVRSAPESWVADTDARRVISSFLDALAAEAWDLAWGYLVGEGTSAEVSDRWDDPWAVDPNVVLPEFCASALCRSEYALGETIRTDPYGRTVMVRFFGRDGPVDKAIGVGSFEGHLSVSHLPPEGRDGEAPPGTSGVLFGDESHGPLVVLRYDAVELIGADGSSALQRFWPGRYIWLPFIVDDWVVWDGGWGDVYAAPIDAGTRQLISDDEGLHAAGAARIGDVAYALVAGVDGLFAHDLTTGDRVRLIDGGDEEFINYASITDDVLVTTVGAGDSVWFEVFALSGTGNAMRTEFLRRISPPGAAGQAHLSPDGSHMAYIVEETLHIPTIVAVSDLTGREIARWSVPSDRVIGPVSFDGRWVLGRLWDRDTIYWQSDETGERLVIDTVNGEARVIASFDFFVFR